MMRPAIRGRRSSLLLTVLAVAVAVVAAACASDEAPTSGTTATPVATTSDQVTTTGSTAPATGEPAGDETPADADSGTVPPAAVDGSGCGAEVVPGRSTVSFDFEDRTREYELVVPPDYDPSVPTPLVLNWHGLGSNGPDQLGFSEYPALAAREGFLVVAPTGVPAPDQTLNSWELTDDDDPTRDDVAFAEAVLDRMIATACVDESRVYTTGMSNGGYFSTRLVCELADRIAAASAVAALFHPDDCEPSRPVPLLGFHGVDDAVVPYDGGGFSSLFPQEPLELFEPAIPDEFAEFAVGYGCAPDPIEESISDDVTAFRYEGCPAGIEATFYRIGGGGHTWPGSTISLSIGQAAGLGATTTDINATELSWEFFSRHSLPG